MTKMMMFGLAMISLSLGACVAPSGSEGTGEPIASVEQAQIANPPGAGESCHITSEGIVFGTMTADGWCCGSRLCNDKVTCGADYGKVEQSCGLCSFYTCTGGWLRPENLSPNVRLFGVDKTERVVSDDKGYAIPFTPVKQ